MRDLFPGYYRPTEEEFNQLWDECIFVFDTNILLNVYRYSEKTRERLFEVLEKLKERIWIPHQVADEYQKNRLGVISEQLKPYDEIENILNDNIKKVEKELEKYKKKHSLTDYIEIEQIIKILDRANKNTSR